MTCFLWLVKFSIQACRFTEFIIAFRSFESWLGGWLIYWELSLEPAIVHDFPATVDSKSVFQWFCWLPTSSIPKYMLTTILLLISRYFEHQMFNTLTYTHITFTVNTCPCMQMTETAWYSYHIPIVNNKYNIKKQAIEPSQIWYGINYFISVAKMTTNQITNVNVAAEGYQTKLVTLISSVIYHTRHSEESGSNNQRRLMTCKESFWHARKDGEI